MAAGDWNITQLFHPSAHLHLMRRVAYAKRGRDSECRNAVFVAHNGCACGSFIQGLGRQSARIVPTWQANNGFIAKQVDEPAAFDLQRFIAQQQNAHRRAFTLHHRIGGQGRRQRNQADLRQQVLG